MSSLVNKIVLITGGGSGIGRATCIMAAREGARVVVTDKNLETALQTLTLLNGPDYMHIALAIDVCKKESIEAAFNQIQEHYGVPPSNLVNNAAVSIIKPFLNVTEEEFYMQMDVNVKGPILVSQIFCNRLLSAVRDGDREGVGCIVNIASTAAKVGQPNLSIYSSTKGALVTLTKTCASELASKGIRVNCVLPALINTERTKDLTEEKRAVFRSATPMGREGEPQEVAEAVVFLLSDKSSYMTGACIDVAGGFGM